MVISLEVDVDKIRNYLCMTVSNSDLIPEIALKWSDEDVFKRYLDLIDITSSIKISNIDYLRRCKT